MTRKTIVALLSAVLVFTILPAAASAKKTCKTPYPHSQFKLKISNGTCGLAQAVDRYIANHEIFGAQFIVETRRWIGKIYSRKHGHTYYNFVSPAQHPASVWITFKFPVS